jgi:hypothetical protein
MIPVIAQIDQLPAIRAAAEPLRRAPDRTPSYVAEQPARDAAPVKAPQQVPVVNNDEVRLSVNAETHEVIATLVDAQTHEVIRQIPGEETRRAREVIRAIAGQLLDKLA